MSIGTSSANSLNSVEPDLICTSRIYFDSVTLMLHNVTLMSQKPCQHTTKCDYSNHFFINEVYILNETSKPPVNTTHFFNIAHLLFNCLT